jgi:hypothetical protein
VAAAALPVMPCHDCVKATTSCRPVTSLAMRSAASFDSAPVLKSRQRSSPGGACRAISAASATTGRDSMPLKRWSSERICSVTTATMSGCEWPSSALIWPEVKSRMPRPSAS